MRPESQWNDSMATGKIEVVAEQGGVAERIRSDALVDDG